MVLCALGLSIEGTPSRLLTRAVAREDEQAWLGVVRGLQTTKNGNPLLICCDGHPAVLRAAQAVYPETAVQISIAHRLLELAREVDRPHRAACLAQAREIFLAPDREAAVARFRSWRDCWTGREKEAVTRLERDLPRCLAFYRFPPHLWTKIRTVNLLERASREARRTVSSAAPSGEPGGDTRSAEMPTATSSSAAVTSADARGETDEPAPDPKPDKAGPSVDSLFASLPAGDAAEDVAMSVLIHGIGPLPPDESEFATIDAAAEGTSAGTPPAPGPAPGASDAIRPSGERAAEHQRPAHPGPASPGYFVDLGSDTTLIRWRDRSRRARAVRWALFGALIIAAGFVVGLAVAAAR